MRVNQDLPLALCILNDKAWRLVRVFEVSDAEVEGTSCWRIARGLV